MGSSNGIVVQVDSALPLPTNFAVAFNQDEIDVDECKNDEFAFDQNIEFNSDRTKAKIFLNLDFHSSQVLSQKYIPDYSKPPQSNLIDINFFSRASCGDTPNKIQALKDVQMTWRPIYANGEHCGVSSYEATAQVQL